MRWTQSLIPTLKESPAEAEATSHKLMIRAGLIRKLSSGFYSYLPLGLRVLQKIENIVREEMDRAGSLEVLMPAMHPSELWKKTGRLKLLGEDMYSLKDRTGKEMVLGPTHEEVITSLVANEVRSYKELPLILYQIQTKFRDEPRPRFGVIRSREFIMKDAYSFDRDTKGLSVSYQKMYDAYCRIFSRCGLEYLAVEADPGFMGGDISHEFMVLAQSGEDLIAHCSFCGYGASMDCAECPASPMEDKDLDRLRRVRRSKAKTTPEKLAPVKEVDTPEVSTVEKVSQLLKVTPDKLIKTLIYIADGRPVAALVRGDHDLSEVKLRRTLGCKQLVMADAATIEKVTGGPLGFSGPVGLKGIEIIADFGVKGAKDAVTGANKKNKHLVNVNIDRDFKVDKFADLRYVVEGDICPKCKKPIAMKRAIEVGHVFKLGTRYSQDLEAKYLDEEGREKVMIMGCYGIGVNRIMAACIEQNNDKHGVIWPASIAPYEALVVPLNVADSKLLEASEGVYEQLSKAGVATLLDDRDERAGVKFKDADLIGIPLQVVIGEKYKKDGQLEIKLRATGETHKVDIKSVASGVKKSLTLK